MSDELNDRLENAGIARRDPEWSLRQLVDQPIKLRGVKPALNAAASPRSCELIDAAGVPIDPELDPFYRHLMAEKEGSEIAYSAQDAKRELYRPMPRLSPSLRAWA